MEVERLGKVRVGDGVYARELQQRAIQKGMTVVVEKTIEGNARYLEIIHHRGSGYNWSEFFNQRITLETKVNEAVAAGESVVMIFLSSQS